MWTGLLIVILGALLMWVGPVADGWGPVAYSLMLVAGAVLLLVNRSRRSRNGSP